MGILNAITNAAPVLGVVFFMLGGTLGSNVKPAALQRLRNVVGASLGRQIFWQLASAMVVWIFFLMLMSAFMCRAFQGVFACISMGVTPVMWYAIGAVPWKTARDDTKN